MSIGINFKGQRSYRSAEVNCINQIEKHTGTNTTCNCGCTSGSTSGCNCQPPKVWPIVDNPPARPAVMPRPYPPDFVLPPEAALLSVNKENTEITVHHLCCKKPIEAYISSYIFEQDYNLSCLLSTYTNDCVSAIGLAASAYTDLKIYELSAYYGQNVRFCGYTPSAVTNMWTTLAAFASQVLWDKEAVSAYIEKHTDYKLFNDLRKGDFFYSVTSTQLSGSLMSTLTLVEEYICIDNILSAAKFEKLGSNNIFEIEKAINRLDKKIDDTKVEVQAYTDEQILILEGKAAASAVQAKEEAIGAAKVYTDDEIKKLGIVFNIKGFMTNVYEDQFLKPYQYLSILLEKQHYEDYKKCTSGLRAGDIYLTRQQEPLSGIAEYLFTGQDNLSTTVILSTYWEKLGSNSGYALSTDVKALVEATSALTLIKANEYTDQEIDILEASAAASTEFAIISSKTYTDQLVAVSTQFAITSSKTYTDQVSTAFADALTGKLVEELSGTMIYKDYPCVNPEHHNRFPWIAVKQHTDLSSHIYQGYVYLTDVEVNGVTQKQQFMYIADDNTKTALSTAWLKLGYTTDLVPTSSFITALVNTTSSLMSAMIGNGFNTIDNTVKNYTDNLVAVSAQLTYNSGVNYTNRQINSLSGIFDDKLELTSTYIDSEINSARHDLSTYVETTSTNIINYVSGGIVSGFDGNMIYRGYGCQTHKTELPWKAAEHIDLSSYIYKGYVYTASVEVNDKFEDQQFMYITNDKMLTTVASAWLKLGYTTDLKPTSSFINAEINLARTNLSGYVQEVSGNLTTYINTEVISTRSDLSGYVQETSGNLINYTDNAKNEAILSAKSYTNSEISSARHDLSTYVETTSTNIITYVSGGIVSGFDGNMLYEGYFDHEPWQYFKHPDAKIQNLYKGSVFAVSTNILGTADNGEQKVVGTEYIQYMYIEPTNDRKAKSTLSTSYIKLGFTTDLSEYATVNFVKNSDISLSSILSTYTNTKIDLLSATTLNLVKVTSSELSGIFDDKLELTSTYIDSEINSARHDLSTYVETTSTNIITYVSGGIVSGFDGNMIYRDHFLSAAPWDIFKPQTTKILINQLVYKGSVFTVSEPVYGTDDTGMSSYIKHEMVQYMYSKETKDRESLAGVKQSYIKLGSTTDLGKYATVNFVKLEDNKLFNNLTSTIKQSSSFISSAIGNGYSKNYTVLSNINAASANAYNQAVISTQIYTNTQIDKAKLELSTVLSSYTDAQIDNLSSATTNLINETSGKLEIIIDNASSYAYTTSVSSANKYTNEQIENIGTIFVFKGYAENANHKAFPWNVQSVIDTAKKGYVYLTDVVISGGDPSGTIFTETAEYVCVDTTSSIISTISGWQKLGNATLSNSYATTYFVKQQDIALSGILSTYTNTTVKALSDIVSGNIDQASSNLVQLISNTSSVTLLSAASTAQNYTNSKINQLSSTTTGLVKQTKDDLINVIDIISGQTFNKSVATAYLSSTIYTNQTIKLAKEELSGHVSQTSSNIINYVTDSISTGFSGTMVYRDIILSSQPWIQFNPSFESETIDKLVYKGSVFLVNEPVYRTNENGEIITSNELVQYMYKQSRENRQTAARLKDSYVKLGFTTNLSEYATINYVKKLDTALSGLLSSYTDTEVTSARNNLSSYVQEVSGNLQTYTDTEVISVRNDLSSYVQEASGNLVGYTTTEVTSVRSDLSSYVQEASGNLVNYTDTAKSDAINSAKSYTDTEITSTRSDLSGYVQETSSNLVNYTDIVKEAAITSATSYTDTEVTSARSDLSSYVQEASGNLQTYTDNKISGLGKVFKFKGYTSDRTSATLPTATSATIGDVYLVDVIIDNITETAQVVGVEKKTDYSVSYNWQQLGVKTSVGTYATKVYVDQQDSILSSAIIAAKEQAINAAAISAGQISSAVAGSAVTFNTNIAANTAKLNGIDSTVTSYVTIKTEEVLTASKSYIDQKIGTSADIADNQNTVYGYINKTNNYLTNAITGTNGSIDTAINTFETNKIIPIITKLDGIDSTVTGYVNKRLGEGFVDADQTVTKYIKMTNDNLADAITGTTTRTGIIEQQITSAATFYTIHTLNPALNAITGNYIGIIDTRVRTTSSVLQLEIQSLTDIVNNLSGSTSADLVAIWNKLSEHTNTLSTYNTRISQNENNINIHTNQINYLSGKIDQINTMLGDLSEKLDTYNNTLVAIATKLDNLNI